MKNKNVNLLVYGLVILSVILVMAKLNGCSPAPSGDGDGDLSITDRYPALDSTKGTVNFVMSITFNMDMVTSESTIPLTATFESSLFSKGTDHTAGTCETNGYPDPQGRWETKRILRVFVTGPLVTSESPKVVHIIAKENAFISASGKKLAAGTTLWKFTYDNSSANWNISGNCYGGSAGPYIVGVFDSNPGNPYAAPLTGTAEITSAYTVRGLANNTYYVAAFRDTNLNDRYDSGEPWGEYGGDPGSPVVVSGVNRTEIDITVEAD